MARIPLSEKYLRATLTIDPVDIETEIANALAAEISAEIDREWLDAADITRYLDQYEVLDIPNVVKDVLGWFEQRQVRVDQNRSAKMVRDKMRWTIQFIFVQPDDEIRWGRDLTTYIRGLSFTMSMSPIGIITTGTP
jgi:hypothetical protein